jgi:hypothetical protein
LPRDVGLWIPYLSLSSPLLKAVRIDDCGVLSMDVLVKFLSYYKLFCPNFLIILKVALWRQLSSLQALVLRKLRLPAAFNDLVPRPSLTHLLLGKYFLNFPVETH